MNALLEELEDALKVETLKLKNAPFINKAMGIIEIIRSIDDIHCFYSYSGIQETEDNIKWYQYFKTHNSGFYGCYEQLCYDESKINKSNILYESSGNSKRWANEKLQRSGIIGLINRFIQLARQGVFEIEKVLPYEIEFKCKLKSSGAEILETKYQKEYLHRIAHEKLRNPRIKELEPIVLLELEKRVLIDNTHFIKYNSSPLIDEFYLLEAGAISHSFVGNDTFKEDSEFNRVSFGTIKKVMTLLVANSLKHFNFGQAALRKYALKKLNPWNFYSTPYNIEDLNKWVSNETKVPLSVVEWIIGILTLTKDNLEPHLGAPGSSLPLLIKIEKNWLLRSLAGCLQNPYTYLIRHLKHYYNLDYSIAVNRREEIFKQEFYSLFDSENILKCERNVELKQGRNVLTDIDALLYDVKSKTLLLVQLKWMDDFGTSMKQRKSMATNFQNSITKWINNVENWSNENGNVALLKYFEMDHTGLEVKDTKLLILGRYFTQFSDVEIDSRAVYCGWPQLLHIIGKKNVRKSLPKLIKEVDKGSVKKINLNEIMQAEKFQIGDYSIVVKFS